MSKLTRRGFLQETAILGTAVAAMGLTRDAWGAEPIGEMPKIRLGGLEVSRLILGSNPFFGYAHQQGDLGKQMVEYYTDERIMQVLDSAAEVGITTVTAPPDVRWANLYKQYLEKGGKLHTWIAQCHGNPAKMLQEIDRAVDGGAKAVFIQGHRTEDHFAAGKIDVVRSWVEHIKSHKVPAGLAAHRPDVHPTAEKEGFPTDFYFQCFFRPDTYLPEERELAIATIRQITKPMIGYKLLAAGRLKPEEAFAYALKHLAPKDGMCVGVFPKVKADMLAEDAKLVVSG
jgi:hypothetical protein